MVFTTKDTKSTKDYLFRPYRGTFSKSDDEYYESAYRLFLIVFGGGWVGVPRNLSKTLKVD